MIGLIDIDMVKSVDEIWDELKEEGRDCISFEKSKKNRSLGRTKFKNKKSTKNSSKRILQQISNVLTSSCCIDPVVTVAVDDSVSEEIEELSIALNDFDASTALIDSDDEEDEVGKVEKTLAFQSLEEASTATCRVGWYASALKSNNLTDRINALEQLYKLLLGLQSQFAVLPDLDFPSPYHCDRVSLTYHKNALVSDLSSESHTTHWSKYWKQTDFPLQKAMVSHDDHLKSKFEGESVSENQLTLQKKTQSILDVCGNALFICTGDSKEKCRELAMKCLTVLCPNVVDITKHIPYLMSAILTRFPPSYYDNEMNIFVDDIDSHFAYKRGVAVQRQDKIGLISSSIIFDVVERSEEIRLLLCRFISTLIRTCVAKGSLSILNPYVTDLIQALYTLLRDSFSEVKVEASLLLVQILRIPQWESIAKTFATGLARAVIPNLRHRKSSVKVASLTLFETSAAVPNREKLRGAGSGAILDLVGFREDNVSLYNRPCI